MTEQEENDKSGSVHTILAALDGSPIFEQLLKEWEFLAMNLNVPPSIIQHWRLHILINALSPKEILEEILLNWKQRCGEKANLVSLIKVLEQDCKWLNMCGHLEDRMEALQRYPIEENTLWADLPKCLKSELLSKKVEFLGIKKPFFDITACIKQNVLSSIFAEYLKGSTLMNLASRKEFNLAANSIPDAIPYYMSRRLSLALGETVDEEQVIDVQFRNHESKGICIAGLSGIGKSTLIARLAQSIQTKYPDRIVIFLKMHHLVQEMGKYKTSDYSRQIKQTIADLLANTNLGKKILLEIFSNSAYQIELFLDGCDEVAFEQHGIVKRILKYVLQNCPNLRLVFTSSSGSHFKYEEIANRFETIIYSIQPFSEAEKVQFLVNYWHCKYSFAKNEYHEGCAESALHLWMKNQRSEEAKKFGTPLQLRLLAHVVADNSQKPTGEKFVKVTTPFQVFRAFMHKLFEDDSNVNKAEHTRLAVLSVYPEISKHFLTFCKKSTAPLDQKIVQAFGLLRADMVKKRELEFVHRTFAEYLVAELFMDAFISTNTGNHSKGITDVCSLMRFLFQAATGRNENTVSFQQHSLCYFLDGLVQTKCNHLNIGHERGHSSFNLTAISNDVIPNVADILKACTYHHYYGLLCFIIETFLSGSKSEALSVIKDLGANHDIWLRILTTASQMGLLDSVSRVYQYIKGLPNWGGLTNQLSTQLSSWNMIDSRFTPLHAAAAHGNFRVFCNFFSEMGMDVLLQKPSFLLHATVRDSYFNSIDVINEKIEIIKFLLERINPSIILHEKYGMIPEPLLTECMHIQLLEYLIEQGADIFFKTPGDKNNLAHNMADYMTPDEYHYFVKYLLEKKAGRIFGWRNVQNETTLQTALIKIKVKSETLELLINAKGVSTSSRYGYKDSLPYHLIKNGYSQKWLALVIQASPERSLRTYNDADDSRATVLHVAVRWLNVEAVRFLLSLDADPNAADADGKTPLHVACSPDSFIKQCDKLVEIISLLLENGAKAKSEDYSNRQPLSYIFDQL